ncbi:MAG: ABC transporter substrate-binding protein [Nitrospinaceae bacterium]|jgi:taurine transport system substrate-binding protein|nr:ABC transporter substrate-binding protein [Nitrospinaceae bacterium]MBT3823302.1 ABC transporter substrate-binding protein [Nitrospinaceae bacterium]MBT4095231.1 ABC transporter substrate-binding protein [Nitrospinaceae bacterium]MBT4429378.1 ABC transporter substrate-binding protein [Nitrospinaceae bacterium]MBT5367573.1 ABC transporter substrate-binding protein [Nitrospinaceae bacterium]
MKKIFGFLLAAVLLVGFSGVTVADAAKLRIGAHRSLWGSFEIIADKMGYWKAEGLDYEVGHYKQGKLMRNAIIQGNLDTGTTGFSPFTTAISKGAKVQAIGVTANICAATAIVVPVKSKAKTLADVKGMVFANKKGTSTDFAFQSYVIPAYGLKSSDFPLLSVRATERIAALISGNAGAAIVGEPQTTIAVQKGLVRRLEDLCKYDKTRMMHIGNPATIKKNPDLYVKYFRGWLKSHKLLKNDPLKYAQVYTRALQEVGDKAKLSYMKDVVKKLKTDVFIDMETKKYLNDMAGKQKKLGWIKRAADFTTSKFVDDSILRKVAKEMNFMN